MSKSPKALRALTRDVHAAEKTLRRALRCDDPEATSRAMFALPAAKGALLAALPELAGPFGIVASDGKWALWPCQGGAGRPTCFQWGTRLEGDFYSISGHTDPVDPERPRSGLRLAAHVPSGIGVNLPRIVPPEVLLALAHASAAMRGIPAGDHDDLGDAAQPLLRALAMMRPRSTP